MPADIQLGLFTPLRSRHWRSAPKPDTERNLSAQRESLRDGYTAFKIQPKSASAFEKARRDMNVSGLIRVVSIALTAVVVLSFGMFVWDELGSASKHQSQIANEENPTFAPAVRDVHGRLKADENSKLRVNIDKVNDAVTSPGEQIGKNASNSNIWAMRLASFIFGIALFLIGLRMLASWIEMRGPVQGKTVQRGPTDSYTAGSR
jgi:predicted PurR-regulated permease PerM